MGKFVAKDRVGERYGRLVVLELSHKGKSGHYYWKCQCDCGNVVVVSGSHLGSGHTQSCGCLKVESISRVSKSHGLSKTSTYYVWKCARQRCKNSNNKEYSNYGGRGITFCKRWDNYENFLEDMGERPEGMEIDRIDVNGNYEPENCRWTTSKENQRNRTNNHLITYRGETKCLAAWAEEYEIDYNILSQRVNRDNMSFEEAISGKYFRVKRLAVDVNGNTYPVDVLVKMLNLTRIKITEFLRNNSTRLEDLVLYSQGGYFNKPEVVTDPIDGESLLMKDILKKYGISYGLYRYRVKKGMSLVDILSTPPAPKKWAIVDPKDNTVCSLRELANKYSIKEQTLRARIAAYNWSPEKALGLA
jgi:hypothetical protein